jgi:hypothetical protein
MSPKIVSGILHSLQYSHKGHKKLLAFFIHMGPMVFAGFFKHSLQYLHIISIIVTGFFFATLAIPAYKSHNSCWFSTFIAKLTFCHKINSE